MAGYFYEVVAADDILTVYPKKNTCRVAGNLF